MSSTLALTPSVVKRTWSTAEKLHVVELTMRKGVSVISVAKQYHIHPPILSTWRTLYRNGKLVDNTSENKTIPKAFVPIHITDTHQALPTSTNRISAQIDLPCGTSLCLEADALDLHAIATLFTLVRK